MSGLVRHEPGLLHLGGGRRPRRTAPEHKRPGKPIPRRIPTPPPPTDSATSSGAEYNIKYFRWHEPPSVGGPGRRLSDGPKSIARDGEGAIPAPGIRGSPGGGIR